jgi:hypothetical protein
MKKFSLVVLVSFLSLSPIFANSWSQIGSSCQQRISFFGLLTVWSGSNTEAEYDNFGYPTGNTRSTSCTADGNWDWAW